MDGSLAVTMSALLVAVVPSVYEWASLGVLVAVEWSSLASLGVVVGVKWSSLVAVVVVVPSVYEWASLGVVVAAVERLSSVLTTAHYSQLAGELVPNKVVPLGNIQRPHCFR
jgi:hypothetical protein